MKILTPSPACLDLIKKSEGCKLKAYPDPGSGGKPWTIGWGSTGADISRGTVWTQQQADDRFAADVVRFSGKVRALIGAAATTQGQFDALVSFAYNVGPGSLKVSTLLRKHKAGDYKGAAAEFRKWDFAGGHDLPGLVSRRAAEASLYRGEGA